jgi:hypothetical protein
VQFNKSFTHTIILLLFFAAWLYTEIKEAFERTDYQERMEAFMSAGGRFTNEDGEELRKRIDEIEQECCK